MRLRTVLGGILGLSVAVVAACGSEDSTFGDGDGEDGGAATNSGNPPPSLGDGDGGGGGGGGGQDGGLTGDGAACASSKADAVLAKRPVDIVIVIDNSGSMSGEIKEVEAQINQNFATIIGNSGIDYRVVLLARYGGYNNGQSICISSPLSGANCANIFPNGGAPAGGDAGRPVETARFFQYNQEIASEDAWCRLLDGYAKADNTDGYTLHDAGYGALLRANAFKTIVLISDDGMTCSGTFKKPDGGGNITGSYDDQAGNVDAGFAAAALFDQHLKQLDPVQFTDGDGGRNYVFHAIVANAPYGQDAGLGDTNVHPPTAPVVTGMCTPGAQEPGTGSQALSVITGGLRYPSCTLNYTTIFQQIAKGVVASSGVSCDFAVPQPAPGETLDLNTLAVQYTPGGGGAVQEFTRANDLASCAPGKFWLEGGANGVVHLCPDTCTAVKSDLGASVSVVSGCARLNPTPGGGGPN